MANANFGGKVGWAVGIFDWLNSPESKVNRYWRVIEETGDSTWVGQPIVGLWGDQAGPRGELIKGSLTPFDSGGGAEKFVPFFPAKDQDLLRAARAALAYFFDIGGRRPVSAASPAKLRLLGGFSVADDRRWLWWLLSGSAQLNNFPFVVGHVRVPVVAVHHYARAVAAFQPLQAEMAALRAVFPSIANPASNAGRKALRAAAVSASGSAKTGALSNNRVYSPAEVRGYLSSRHQGFVTMGASVAVTDLLRDSRFFSTGQMQSQLMEVNARVAKQFQAEVVAQMQKVRTNRPATEALIEATGAQENRYPM